MTKKKFPDTEKQKNHKKIDPEWLNIQNIVSTFNTNNELNLSKISLENPSMTYPKPDNFSALIHRQQIRTEDDSGTKTKKKKVSINIFPSGKTVLAGTKTLDSSLFCIYVTLNSLNRNNTIIHDKRENIKGIIKERRKKITINHMAIKNMVGTLKTQNKIDLKSLSENEEYMNYDETKFPGLNIPPKPGTSITANVFKSGYMGIAGAKSHEEMLEYANYFYNIVSPYFIKEGDE